VSNGAVLGAILTIISLVPFDDAPKVAGAETFALGKIKELNATLPKK
jgi:hypothetical protein